MEKAPPKAKVPWMGRRPTSHHRKMALRQVTWRLKAAPTARDPTDQVDRPPSMGQVLRAQDRDPTDQGALPPSMGQVLRAQDPVDRADRPLDLIQDPLAQDRADRPLDLIQDPLAQGQAVRVDLAPIQDLALAQPSAAAALVIHSVAVALTTPLVAAALTTPLAVAALTARLAVASTTRSAAAEILATPSISWGTL